jgi:hypothetical protein
LLEADVLVLGLNGGAAAVLGDPVFANLDIARPGRVIMLPEVSRTAAAMTFGSALNLRQRSRRRCPAWPPHWTATRPWW